MIMFALIFLIIGIIFIIKNLINLEVFLILFINIFLILCITNISNRNVDFYKEGKLDVTNIQKKNNTMLSYKKVKILAFIFGIITLVVICFHGLFQMYSINDFPYIKEVIGILLLGQFIATRRVFKYWDIIVYINTDYEEIYLK